jgi:hypothetical protein
MSDSQRVPKRIGSISVTNLLPTDSEIEISSTTHGIYQLAQQILEISIPIRVGLLDLPIK